MNDLGKLSAQGRAYSSGRPWSNEELDALLLLEKERGVSRVIAADFIRNGIMSLADYDRAKEADFVPKTVAEAITEAEASLKKNEFATGSDVKVEEPVEVKVEEPVEEKIEEPNE